MKFLRWLNITTPALVRLKPHGARVVPALYGIVILTFLTACTPSGMGIPGFPTNTSLPQPIVTIVPAPNQDAAVAAYLDAFKADDYNTMYGLLSKASQDSITLQDFAKRNKEAIDEMSAGSFDYQILSSLP